MTDYQILVKVPSMEEWGTHGQTFETLENAQTELSRYASRFLDGSTRFQIVRRDTTVLLESDKNTLLSDNK